MWSTVRNLYRSVLVPRYPYTETYEQLRARVTLTMCSLFAVLELIVVLCSFLTPFRGTLNSDVRLANVIALIVTVLLFVLVHTGQLRLVAWSVLILLVAASVAAAQNGAATGLLIVMAITILYAGIVAQWRGVLIFTLLEVALLILTIYGQSRGDIVPLDLSSPDSLPLLALITLAQLIGVAVIALALMQEVQRAFNRSNQLKMRLRAVNDVAQMTANILNLNEFLQRTVNTIRDRFGFFHVQIFLIDADRKYATLTASTGQTGAILLQRGYRLAVGSSGPIGQAAATGEVCSAVIGPDADLQVHELLKDMQAELSLPFISANQVIGVLDVQSTRPDAFAEEDMESLRLLATQVAVSIRIIQNYEEQRATLNDTRRLFLEAETNLRESQRLNRQLTGQNWQEYMNQRDVTGIGYTLSDNRLLADTKWTPALVQAATQHQPVFTESGDHQIVAVPVELRGYVIGAIEVELGSNVNQSDTLQMLQSVAQRLALSIDNARLFEETQEAGQQELEVNTISAKIQGMTELPEVVKTILHELGRAIGAEQASVRLSTQAQLETEHRS